MPADAGIHPARLRKPPDGFPRPRERRINTRTRLATVMPAEAGIHPACLRKPPDGFPLSAGTTDKHPHAPRHRHARGRGHPSACLRTHLTRCSSRVRGNDGRHPHAPSSPSRVCAPSHRHARRTRGHPSGTFAPSSPSFPRTRDPSGASRKPPDGFPRPRERRINTRTRHRHRHARGRGHPSGVFCTIVTVMPADAGIHLRVCANHPMGSHCPRERRITSARASPPSCPRKQASIRRVCANRPDGFPLPRERRINTRTRHRHRHAHGRGHPSRACIVANDRYIRASPPCMPAFTTRHPSACLHHLTVMPADAGIHPARLRKPPDGFPLSAGTTEKADSLPFHNTRPQVTPFRVLFLDQLDLPCATPLLDLLLPLNGFDHADV